MMANGQQKAQQTLKAFELWVSTQTNDDFTQLIYGEKLNRGEIAKAIGCGKSALNQNPALKTALGNLEDRLRKEGVLPPLTVKAKEESDKPKQYDNTTHKRHLESKRLSAIEAENIELKAKIKELESKLERFGELSDTLYEMGFMPR
ncbi:VPA1267 family protein [Pseudoalteromonas sp. A41-2]|uniref:VPA1267 family protein n=1 Tax=Pseudoalteromonas sp. A41-2 TaxID=2785910 RepID=UPI001E55B5D9|nr:VPA1267 family protein [Pseudoalteromonas sp. A41-2]|tara:strand:- start:214 stop:654 length:441 start_codon:yes stop_codon:yes gene_type:complete